MLMLFTCSLGASEHEAVCESESQRALFAAIKGPMMGCESGNCNAGIALTFSPLSVYMVFQKSHGNLKMLFYLILAFNYTAYILYNI